jgi:hypothetical protein
MAVPGERLRGGDLMAVTTGRNARSPASAETRGGSFAPNDTDDTRAVAILGLRGKMIVSGSRDALVAAIAARQRGRVCRPQLLAAGLSVGQINQMVDAHRMFRLHPGVYAVGHPGPVPLGRETAAPLAVRGDAMLSHTSAAALWGLLDATEEDPVEVVVDASRTARRAGIRCHRTRLLAPADRRTRHGLPVCSPARALLDIAGTLAESRLVRAYDRGQIAGVVRPRDLEELLARVGDHPHRSRFAVLLADRPGITRFEAEQLLLALIRDADLPLPPRQPASSWLRGRLPLAAGRARRRGRRLRVSLLARGL